MDEKGVNSARGSNRDETYIPLLRRGSQSRVPLKAAIIGGGKACDDLLILFSQERLKRLDMEIIGVADPDSNAPGLSRARDMGIFTTDDFTGLYSLPGLNLLIELTGSNHVREEIIRTKPLQVSSIDHRGARLLWDLVQIETEKQVLQQKADQKLRQFLESAQDIICIKDLKGRYLYVNPATMHYMRIPRDQVIGKTDSEIFRGPLAKAMAAHDQEVLDKGRTLFFNEKMTGNGQTYHFHTVRFPILNDQGEMVSLAIMARDMTEEVELQEEVRQHKEYLENILANSSDMIITTDLRGHIVTFNPAGEHMLGYSREEILGVGIEKVWKAPEMRKQLMARVKARGAVSNYPATLIAKNGDKVEVSLSLSQLRDSDGNILGTVGISKDVTEENRLRRQLMEQERLAAVGETVAGVTHCMKNVLNGLKGGSYMLNVGLKRNDSKLVEEGWGNVQKGIDRIHRLSLDMLSYCRNRKPTPVPTDPMQFAQETADLISKSTEQEGISISCHGEKGSPVELDPDAMGRALLNIIANAVDACREKSYAEGEAPKVEVSVKRGKGDLRFIVADNGVGMSEDTRNKLFSRFFSTKEGRGTGLGLCVTEKIIEEHGGKILVESSPGRGSTFTIRLPDIPVQGSTCNVSKQC
ncbi:MAG: PAS domain-containing protein [Deltaproteobacteria bacterium]|nr:PAS domain-containing protein [Deltaproteobacteria bacterium]MBW2352443.1 PAS domain-containing protein [Deltaproteobacteria bacterium]HDZ24257.1 PAS domain S-box protein [Desulfobacteraceae bacterium]